MIIIEFLLRLIYCIFYLLARPVIWLNVSGVSILKICTDFINPFAQIIGMDGVILMGFILGFPANEIVIPIIIMAYMSTGKLVEITELSELKRLFVDNQGR